jgi:RNA polymerase sigma-70 factor (ECF subfamily)
VTSGFPNIDQDLLRLIAGGCERSFRKLYDLYAAKVYTMAIGYLKSTIEAQDVVQEVFVKIWEKRGSLTGIDNFPAYLYVTTRNLLINQLQKKIPVFDQNELTLPSTPDRHLLHQQLDYRELTVLISKAITELPPRQQQVYRLSREQGLNHQQIAKKLSLSYDTVREHMSKALKNIRASLEKQYGQLGLLLWLFWQE